MALVSCVTTPFVVVTLVKGTKGTLWAGAEVAGRRMSRASRERKLRIGRTVLRSEVLAVSVVAGVMLISVTLLGCAPVTSPQPRRKS